MNTPIQWSGRTTAFEHNSDQNWAENLPLPPTVAQGLRQVWWQEARQGRAFELDTPPPTVPQGATQVWFLDAQGSTCPIEVADEVHELWRHHELGNEDFYLETCLGNLKDLHAERRVNLPALLQWLHEQAPQIGEDDKLVIRWWW